MSLTFRIEYFVVVVFSVLGLKAIYANCLAWHL